jgi:multiple sugar transport system permease protein
MGDHVERIPVPARTATPGAAQAAGGWSAARKREALAGYLFLLPNLIGLLVFLAVPLVTSLWTSFTNDDGGKNVKFIGLQNYFDAFGDATFRQAVGNTGVFLLGFLPLSILPALGLAVMLNSHIRGKTVFRVVFFLPVVASVVGVSLLWRWLFQYDFGPINQFLGVFGIGKIHWLERPEWAMISVIIVASWQSIGYNMVLFLAGLQGIPKQLYEAAVVDGATEWQQFRRVTLPLLTPAGFFVLVTSLIKGLQVFSEPATIFNGGSPANSALTVVWDLYQEGFRYFNYGYAAAIAWLLFLVIFAVTLIQFRLSERWVNYE